MFLLTGFKSDKTMSNMLLISEKIVFTFFTDTILLFHEYFSINNSICGSKSPARSLTVKVGIYSVIVIKKINYVLEDNIPMNNAIRKLNAKPSRRYRIYQREI